MPTSMMNHYQLSRRLRPVSYTHLGETVVECTYVEGDGKYARFFAQPVRLGKEGVEEILPIGTLSKFCLLYTSKRRQNERTRKKRLVP